ncbi:hypothetical protein TrVE_jg12490 [Triparma verrucosa]|uniref:FAD-binding FR-type domain-containing protein n=1 Tax=Triparma verrucosa TaxID=1606542 RepID=A0A9W7FAX4_9STRA|nr:hypothetical protein TrVE_jg12490 [Triparma verrucosa]
MKGTPILTPAQGGFIKHFVASNYANGVTGTVEFQAVMGMLTLLFALSLWKIFYNPTIRTLVPDKWIAFKLIKKENISHDTIKVTFENPKGPNAILGLPIGQHISFKFRDQDGKDVIRSYTPITGDEVPGLVTFCIKVYQPNVHPKFPSGGKMSQYVDGVEIGGEVLMRGPKGSLDYKGQGMFDIIKPRKPVDSRKCKHIGMIAGGTGLTPMLQVVMAVLRDENDHTTTIHLLLANQTVSDILLKPTLDNLAKQYPTRFNVTYTLDRPPPTWSGPSGFITKKMIDEHLPTAADDVQIFMCGPPPMIKFACEPNLEKAGFKSNQIYVF